MPDQLESLITTARAMVASQGVPATPQNIQRAVEMLSANPDIVQSQVARRTGISRAPDELYLGDDLKTTPRLASPPAPTQAEFSSLSPQQQQQQQQKQQQASQIDQLVDQEDPNDIADDDEFELIDPSKAPLLVPMAAAAAGSAKQAKDDTFGIDIEGNKPLLLEQQKQAALSNPISEYPQLPPPQSSTIALPDQTSGATITPEVELKTVASKRTGRSYQANIRTGEVLDILTNKRLNSSAAQKLVNSLRRL